MEEREKQLKNFARLFDTVKIDDVESQALIDSLESQKKALQLYSESIETLTKRNLNEELMNEVKSLGINSVAQIAAMAAMSEEELNQYVKLWQEKNELAKEAAASEMSEMKKNMEKQLEEINKSAAEHTSLYTEAYENHFKNLKEIISSEALFVKEEMTQIGYESIDGLIAGLNAKKHELTGAARELAEIISDTFQNALDIHSPSRIMHGFGINIGEGLVRGMDKMVTKVAQSSARLSNAVQNAHSSLASSANRSASVMGPASSSSSSVDNSRHFNPSVTIHTMDSGAKEMQRILRKMAFSF